MHRSLCPICGSPGPKGLACDRPRCAGARYGMRAAREDDDSARRRSGRGGGGTRTDLSSFDSPEWGAEARHDARDEADRYDARDDSEPSDELIAAPDAWPQQALAVARAPAPRKRRVAVALVAIGVLGGAGAVVAVVASQGSGEPARTLDGDLAQREAPPLEVPVAPAAVHVADDAAVHAPEVSREPTAPPEPPRWVAAVARSNPWIAVKPARAAVVLGVSAASLRTPEGRRTTTGFFPHKRVLAPTRAFEVQQHEVTWSELELYLAADGRTGPTRPSWVSDDPAARARVPATNVPWALAGAFCAALGGSLPSEAEWEWAARGGEPSLRTYPWGEALPHAARVHFRRGEAMPLFEVATAEQDVTPAGVHDLLGNAREWTRDAWTSKRPGGVTIAGSATQRPIRGWPLGAPGASIPLEGASYRARACADDGCREPAGELIGLRCVRPAD